MAAEKINIYLTSANLAELKNLQLLHPEYSISELINQIIYKYFDNRSYSKWYNITVQ